MNIAITSRASLEVPDGINIFIFSVADEMIRMGHQVTVVTSSGSSKKTVAALYEFEHYPEIVSLDDGKDGDFKWHLTRWITKGKTAMKKIGPDIVIINGAIPINFHVPSIVIAHDVESRGNPLVQHLYKKYVYGHSQVRVATSSEIKEELARTGVATDWTVIPTCVQLGRYANEPYERRQRAILHMGTAFYKRPEASLRILESLPSDFVLYVTGPETGSTKAIINSLNPHDRTRVRMLGYVEASELVGILGRVLLTVVPSQYATPVLSPTVLESFASGTPVIASSVSSDLLQDAVNGYVYSDVQVAAEQIKLLSNDGKAWQRLSDSARGTVGRFSAQHIARQYIDLAQAHTRRPVQHLQSQGVTW